MIFSAWIPYALLQGHEDDDVSTFWLSTLKRINSLLFLEALWRELPAHELRKECQEGAFLQNCVGSPSGRSNFNRFWGRPGVYHMFICVGTMRAYNT